MHLSSEGLRLIKSFEGYHTRLQNGDCAAYLCPAKVPTIGYGCTEGVKLGMVWSEEKAEAELRKEIAKVEAGVSRMVTADLNQNQFDALVSFAYNVGLGGFQQSAVLKRVNSGQWDKVPAALALWNKAGKPLKVQPGLVSRRQREGALFMKPTVAPEVPAMPQAVTPSLPWWKLMLLRLGIGGGVTTAAVSTSDVGYMPPAPDLSWFVSWKGFGQTAGELGLWALANPGKTLFVAIVLAVLAFPKLLPAKWRPA